VCESDLMGEIGLKTSYLTSDAHCTNMIFLLLFSLKIDFW